MDRMTACQLGGAMQGHMHVYACTCMQVEHVWAGCQVGGAVQWQ